MQIVIGKTNMDSKWILYIELTKEVISKLPFNIQWKTCLHINKRGSIRAFAPKLKITDGLDDIIKELEI